MDLTFKETFADFLNILKLTQSLNQSISYFNKEWTLNIEEDLEKTFEDIINELEDGKTKLLQRKKKCIIFGETSAGKSYFINALFDFTLLQSGNGTTSVGYVTIKKSLNEDSYIEIEKEDHQQHIRSQVSNGNCELLSQIMTEIPCSSLANDPVSSGGKFRSLTVYNILKELNDSEQIYYADLFYNKGLWPFSSEHIEIIDTPGINEDDETDEDVNRYCDDARLVILIVDSTRNINKTLKKFVSNFQKAFLKLHIFIVFTKWDIIEVDEMKKVHSRHLTFAMQLLRQNLRYSEEEARKRIFFLSPKYQIQNKNGPSIETQDKEKDKTVKKYMDNFKTFLMEVEKEMEDKHSGASIETQDKEKDKTVKKYMDNFKTFLMEVEKEMEDKQREMSFLHEIQKTVKEKVKPLQEMMSKMKNRIEDLTKSYGERKNKTEIVKQKILDTISTTCDQKNRKFKDEVIKRIKLKVKKIQITQQEKVEMAKELEEQVLEEQNDICSTTTDENDQTDIDPLIELVDDANIPLLEPSSENQSKDDKKDDKKELLLFLVRSMLTKVVNEEIVDKLKREFTELVKDQYDEYMTDRLRVTDFEYNPQEMKQNIFSFTPIFLENILHIRAERLSTKIKIIAGSVAAVSAGLMAATGGVAGAIVAPIEFAVASYIGIGIGAAIGGATVGGGIATGIAHLVKINWKNKREKSDRIALETWRTFENQIREKYLKFCDDCTQDLEKNFKDLDEKFNSLKHYLAMLDRKMVALNNSVPRRLF